MRPLCGATAAQIADGALATFVVTKCRTKTGVNDLTKKHHRESDHEHEANKTDASRLTIGIHVTVLPVPPPNSAAYSQMSVDERRPFTRYWDEGPSVCELQARESQTVACGLADSRVGWLAWTPMEFQDDVDNDD
jgi:hypothetical protein